MSNRQLLLLIGATTVLALTLAWVIERAQVRAFVKEFGGRPTTDGGTVDD